MISIAILGAAGRMGQSLIRCAARFDDIRVAAAIEADGHARIGEDAGTVAGIGPLGVAIDANREAAGAAQVFIDFTFHTAAAANASLAADAGRAIVIGTTGLTDEEAQTVRGTAQRVPVLWAPNMSPGVNLLFNLAREAASALGLDYDVEIVETHHRHKKDAPSGTALKLAAEIADGRRQDPASVVTYGRRRDAGQRPEGQIGVHAVRTGDVVGDHTIIFGTDGERIELSCRASSRDIFAMGALRGVKWIHGKAPGLYDMRDVLGLRQG